MKYDRQQGYSSQLRKQNTSKKRRKKEIEKFYLKKKKVYVFIDEFGKW